MPYPGTEQLPRALASPGKEEQPQALSPLTTAPPTAGDSELGTSGHRTSFLARVLLIQSEVKDIQNIATPTTIDREIFTVNFFLRLRWQQKLNAWNFSSVLRTFNFSPCGKN